MDIKEKIIKILSTNSAIENATHYLRENDDLTKLGMSSITFIRAIVDIETEFKFEFEDEDLNYSKFASLKLLCNYIEGQLETRNLGNMN